MRATLAIALLVLALAACSAEGASTSTLPTLPTPGAATVPTEAAAPTQTSGSELMPYESPLAPVRSPTPEQAATNTPASSETAPPAAADTATSEPQSTETAAGSAGSQTVSSLPDQALFTWTQVASGLSNPIGLANAGDGSGRLFVLEQRGFIRILQDGALLEQPFLDISAQVDCCGERGLLGIVFHPHYAENGYFYINYTTLQGDQLTTVIARYQVSGDANIADPNSELRLFEQPQPFPNHNGGGLQFGPDGYLYIGLGDGGSAGDPRGNGQSTETKLGKLLRIDVDGGDPYAIPPDNPFGRGGGLGEIWAYGLRNPWRFSFDALTGDLYIGDVGQGSWEEIDFLPAGSPGGANFGWNYREGAHPYEGEPPAGVELIEPVAEYSHAQGISVTGGYVYRGPSLAEWQGVYLYGDYGSGYVWGLLRKADGTWENKLMFQTETSVTSFGVDEAGEVYLVDYRGNIWRLDRK